MPAIFAMHITPYVEVMSDAKTEPIESDVGGSAGKS